MSKNDFEQNQPCPCSSSKSYKTCCRPLLYEGVVAKTPLALMRSRFCAFYLGGHGAYLLKTWLPIRRAGLSVDPLSTKALSWTRLEIVSKSQSGNQGIVEFKAYYRDDSMVEQVHHERSLFRRIDGVWFYDYAIG